MDEQLEEASQLPEIIPPDESTKKHTPNFKVEWGPEDQSVIKRGKRVHKSSNNRHLYHKPNFTATGAQKARLVSFNSQGFKPLTRTASEEKLLMPPTPTDEGPIWVLREGYPIWVLRTEVPEYCSSPSSPRPTSPSDSVLSIAFSSGRSSRGSLSSVAPSTDNGRRSPHHKKKKKKLTKKKRNNRKHKKRHGQRERHVVNRSHSKEDKVVFYLTTSDDEESDTEVPADVVREVSTKLDGVIGQLDEKALENLVEMFSRPEKLGNTDKIKSSGSKEENYTSKKKGFMYKCTDTKSITTTHCVKFKVGGVRVEYDLTTESTSKNTETAFATRKQLFGNSGVNIKKKETEV